ncbi:hypothetical protein [Agrococcus jejuensis]|uniref:Uncharacterized protein n=1 Tax=Agrococcus jejuensis TaxID=399736 RepID=A0A1G8BTA4_9MICO|nr:hypothetical protein [Agrococcus jejuensis]SDH36392.1 hypothetical protein SAMN04489720_1047 [Agrococcus jejuensis]
MTTLDVVVEAHASSDRVLQVPLGVDDAARAAWIAEATDRIRPATAHWGEAGEVLVPAVVERATELVQPEDVLVLQLWPEAVPVAGVVRVSVHESPGVDAVRAELLGHDGDVVTALGEARMGVGWEWFHSQEVDDVAIMGWQAAFADERVLVVVTLEPTLAMLLPALLDDVRVLARDLALAIGGEPWQGADLGDPGLSHGGEEWTVRA